MNEDERFRQALSKFISALTASIPTFTGMADDPYSMVREWFIKTAETGSHQGWEARGASDSEVMPKLVEASARMYRLLKAYGLREIDMRSEPIVETMEMSREELKDNGIEVNP